MTFLVGSKGGTRSALPRITVRIVAVVLLMSCVGTSSKAQVRPPAVTPQAVQNPPGNQKTPTLTISQLTQGAEVIAVGKVTATRSEWNRERTRIYTHVTVSVDEYVKGSQPQNTLTIVNPGGEIGTEGELYSESASFRKDEEVLVFAGKDKRGNLRVVGGRQGKFAVTTGRTNGQKIVGAGRSLDDVKREIQNILSKEQ